MPETSLCTVNFKVVQKKMTGGHFTSSRSISSILGRVPYIAWLKPEAAIKACRFRYLFLTCTQVNTIWQYTHVWSTMYLSHRHRSVLQICYDSRLYIPPLSLYTNRWNLSVILNLNWHKMANFSMKNYPVLALLALVVLILGGILEIVAIASPYWVNMHEQTLGNAGHFGLWVGCQTSILFTRCAKEYLIVEGKFGFIQLFTSCRVGVGKTLLAIRPYWILCMKERFRLFWI